MSEQELRYGDEIKAEDERRFEAWQRLIPDARLRDRTRAQIPSPLGLITLIFCINCGTSCGGVYGEVQFIHALCDPCRDRWGGLPGMTETLFTPDIPPKER